MGKISERTAQILNRLFPPLKIHQELLEAKTSIEANQQWAYKEAVRIFPYFDTYWNPKGKSVLDIGTGLGGKLPFYIESGAQIVFGVDINEKAIGAAQKLVRLRNLSASVSLAAADAATLPFRDSTFDIIVSINTFEHIIKIEQALKECYRVLKPTGIALLFLPPYYSPWGPHLELWIHFPWPHLFFSEETLMKVAAREDYKFKIRQRFLEVNQPSWTWSVSKIPDLNRVTIAQFRHMISRSGFVLKQIMLLPVGYEFLRSRRILRYSLLPLLRIMTSIPLLQEIIVTKIACVLQKTAPN